ncbi:MAG: hypothetical protein ACM31L_02390 [Actinomycetota bacterium]
MSLSPALGPCSPNPVCGPAPVPRLPAASPWRRLVRLVEGGVQEVRNWRARERLYAEMCGLDRRELQDMGMSEYDIPGFVAAWRPGRRRLRQ